MPFSSRPTLSALQAQASADLTAALPGADPLLRFNNLGIITRVQARAANAHYSYLDWIALQTTPFSATDDAYVAGWAGLKGLAPKPAVAAAGAVTFTGANGSTVLAGTSLVRGDGAQYATTADATIVGGTATAAIVASTAGAAGNALVGTALTLGAPVAGVASAALVSTAVTGGVDAESTASLQARALQRYRAPPQGGARGDYPAWAMQVTGVTRAWAAPNGMGAGTVVVYVMLDDAESAHGGFPQGTNGVAAADVRGVTATGDQLTVANALLPQQPATALVYVCAPVATPQNFTLSGVPVAVQGLVEPAIADLFLTVGSPGGVFLPDGSTSGVVPLASIWSAIAAATGCYTFQITVPTADVVCAAGHLPTVGAVTFV